MSDKLYRCLPSNNNMVGIEFTKEKVNIYFPIGYNIDGIKDTPKEKEAILQIIRTISLCKNNDTNYEYDYNYGEENGVPINSYLWLLNDYLNNGLYNVREKKYMVSQKGKVNWKKTFSTKAYFSEEEIVYLNPIVEYNSRTDNVITDIHGICVNICIEKLGWLFGDFEKLEQYNEYIPDSIRKVYIDVLRKELAASFNDNKKTLINHLIRVVSEQANEDSNDIVNNILVSKYDHAWETMVKKVFGNDENLKKYFPEIKWSLKYSKNPKPTMRVDSVINKNDILYIIDAKYYKYGIIGEGNLPGAEDVDKQITYGEFNNRKEEFKNVYNAFVIPYNKKQNKFGLEENIVEVGNVTNNARTDDGDEEPYKKIAIILVDTKFLIDTYYNNLNKEKEANISRLIEQIEAAIKFKKKEQNTNK